MKSGDIEALMIFPKINLKDWLPGDIVFDDAGFVPLDLPAGTYDLQIALVDRLKHKPRVLLAIEGKQDDGWYQLGQIKVTEQK